MRPQTQSGPKMRTSKWFWALMALALVAPGALVSAEQGEELSMPQVSVETPGRQLKQVIGCVNCGSNNGNNNGASVSVSQSVSQTSQGGGGGGGLPFVIPGVPIIGHKRMLKQVVGCVNCGSGNGNGNGASVGVSQSATQTIEGGGGSGSPFSFEFPISIPLGGRGHRRMLGQKQQVIGCVNCGSGNGNGNGASVGVSQSATQTSQAGGSDNPFPFSIPITIPLGGHKRMLKQCVDNFASCQSWGRSQCDRPGVADRCPCMCTGTGAAGTQPAVTIIGCKDCGSNNGNNNGASVGVSQAGGK